MHTYNLNDMLQVNGIKIREDVAKQGPLVMFVNLACEIQHYIILCFLLDHLGRPYMIYKLTIFLLDTG